MTHTLKTIRGTSATKYGIVQDDIVIGVVSENVTHHWHAEITEPGRELFTARTGEHWIPMSSRRTRQDMAHAFLDAFNRGEPQLAD